MSGAVVLAFAGSASAHVTVDASTVAVQGGFSVVTLNVPNERDDTGTVKVSVQLPQDHDITFASVQPKQGWSVEMTTREPAAPATGESTATDEVVDTITWTAQGQGIAPQQFDQFRISLGPLPRDVDELRLPTVQSYSDGEQVRWIETGDDAEHPAPLLALGAPAGDPHGGSHDGGSHAGPSATSSEGSGSAAVTASDGDSGSSNALAGVALAVAIVGLVVAGAGLLTSRRRSAA